MKQIARVFLLAVVAAFAGLVVPAGASAFGPLASFGSEGQGAGQMDSPENLAVGLDGRVYVADRGNNRIDVFSPQGEFLFAFGRSVNATMAATDPSICTAASGCVEGEPSAAAGAFDDLRDLAVAPGGNIFAVDSFNGRVNVFSPEGRFLFAFGKDVDPNGSDVCTDNCVFGKGAGAGGLSSPRGVAIDSGRVFVAENANRRVSVFTESGEFLFAFGRNVNPVGLAIDPHVCTATTDCQPGAPAGPGALLTPHGIEVSAGRVYVANSNNARIEVFSTAGQFLFAFGKAVNPNGGDVCDRASDCLHGNTGEGAGQLLQPATIAADARGAIYVGDEHARVSVFTAGGEFMRAFGLGVVDETPVFQQCTAMTGCKEGAGGALLAPGSVEDRGGLAFGRDGSLFVSESATDKARIELFGDPVSPLVATPKPSNSFGLGKLKLNRKKGTATLAVTVSGAGALTLSGRGVRPANRIAAGAATVKLTIKLVGKPKRKLLATGRAKVRASVTFTPSGGEAATQARALVLKKALRQRSRR
jgi:DNA-binding beta-propeller fold protein YncE